MQRYIVHKLMLRVGYCPVIPQLLFSPLLDSLAKSSVKKGEAALSLWELLAQGSKDLRDYRVRLENFSLQLEAWTSCILRNWCRLGTQSQQHWKCWKLSQVAGPQKKDPWTDWKKCLPSKAAVGRSCQPPSISPHCLELSLFKSVEVFIQINFGVAVRFHVLTVYIGAGKLHSF